MFDACFLVSRQSRWRPIESLFPSVQNTVFEDLLDIFSEIWQLGSTLEAEECSKRIFDLSP